MWLVNSSLKVWLKTTFFSNYIIDHTIDNESPDSDNNINDNNVDNDNCDSDDKIDGSHYNDSNNDNNNCDRNDNDHVDGNYGNYDIDNDKKWSKWLK